MTGQGIVRSVSGAQATVQPRPVACFGCLGTSCRNGAVGGAVGGAGRITVENPSELRLAEGQVVEIEFPRGVILFQAFTALCPLPLGFAAAYLLCGALAPASGEPLRAACGVLGLFTTGLALYRFSRRRAALGTRSAKQTAPLPRITRILPAPGGIRCT